MTTHQEGNHGNHQYPELAKLQRKVAFIDSKIVRWLGERRKTSAQIGEVKYKRGERVHNPGKEEAVIARNVAWAKQTGANPDLVKRIYKHEILEDSRVAQQEVYDRYEI